VRCREPQPPAQEVNTMDHFFRQVRFVRTAGRSVLIAATTNLRPSRRSRLGRGKSGRSAFSCSDQNRLRQDHPQDRPTEGEGQRRSSVTWHAKRSYGPTPWVESPLSGPVLMVVEGGSSSVARSHRVQTRRMSNPRLGRTVTSSHVFGDQMDSTSERRM